MQNIKSRLMAATKAPAIAGIYIKSVSVSATYSTAHAPVLTVVWSMPDHGFVSEAVSLPGVEATVYSRPSDTTIVLYRDGLAPSDIEDIVLEAAWQFGAWDVVRSERAPMQSPDDWRMSRYGITSSFGRDTMAVLGQPLTQGDGVPDVAMEEAARDGFVTWRFIPLSLATPTARSRWGDRDKTLNATCQRDGVPPISRGSWTRPREPQTAHDHIYQLGRAPHGNRSKSSRERRGGA